MNADADAARTMFRTYARRRGLTHYQDWGVPEATQLLRHGFAQMVPNLALGELPNGLGDGWLAHASFATDSAAGLEQHEFTVVISRVPESIGFAVRVVCHDRGLSDAERTNPNADAEVVELDDHDVEVESARFLGRYAVATDHDQDRIRVWQLFSPALIDWLTEAAPPRFSFELQDGALCCFVPGFLAEEAELDALCAAAGRIHDRVLELAAAAPTTAAAGPTRSTMIEAELAAHPFARPPQSVWAAARAFGWWGLRQRAQLEARGRGLLSRLRARPGLHPDRRRDLPRRRTHRRRRSPARSPRSPPGGWSPATAPRPGSC